MVRYDYIPLTPKDAHMGKYGEGKSLTNAVANHVDREDKGVTKCDTLGRQKTHIIDSCFL